MDFWRAQYISALHRRTPRPLRCRPPARARSSYSPRTFAGSSSSSFLYADWWTSHLIHVSIQSSPAARPANSLRHYEGRQSLPSPRVCRNRTLQLAAEKTVPPAPLPSAASISKRLSPVTTVCSLSWLLSPDEERSIGPTPRRKINPRTSANLRLLLGLQLSAKPLGSASLGFGRFFLPVLRRIVRRQRPKKVDRYCGYLHSGQKQSFVGLRRFVKR